MDVYTNVQYIHDVWTETENTGKPKTPQHTGSDRVKIRNYRSAVVGLVLLCVLLLTAVIVLSVTIFTNNTEERDEQLNNMTKLIEEKDQLLTRNTHLTEKTDQQQTKINKLTEANDQLLNKNIQLTIERDRLSSNNRELIKQRDQLYQEKNKLFESLKGGWISYRSNLYFISSEKKSWIQSRRYCKERGADLITINNRQERDFIRTETNALIWIGLTDSDVEGRWTWVDGSTLSPGFWNNREPNGERTENCALIDEKGFSDYPCSDLFQWICEKSIFT